MGFIVECLWSDGIVGVSGGKLTSSNIGKGKHFAITIPFIALLLKFNDIVFFDVLLSRDSNTFFVGDSPFFAQGVKSREKPN